MPGFLFVRQAWLAAKLGISNYPMYGVLGVECSNHSVPTIFFNVLAQSFQVGLFHAWKITPTFTPKDILDLGSYTIREAFESRVSG